MKLLDDGLTRDTRAFVRLVEWATQLIDTRNRMQNHFDRRNAKIEAILRGAMYMRELSGCWDREDQLQNAAPIASAALDKMLKDEEIE